MLTFYTIKMSMLFNSYNRQVMHGLLLGDGHLHKNKGKKTNPLYTQTFGQHYELFAQNVFYIFKDFCTTKGLYTYKVKSGINSPFYQRYIVRTKNLEILNEFFNVYYSLNSQGKYIKILPLDIENILTPIVLAFFVMSDGNYHKQHKIIRLCTNNFSKTEVELLSKAILNKFNINNRIEHVRKNQYIIVIRRLQVPIFQSLIKDYIIPSMLYRIGL